MEKSRQDGPPLRCWAEIDLGALERNIGAIRAALPPQVHYLAVVKADAYGHGLRQVVSRLMHSEVAGFAVANLDEAAEVRAVGQGWPILLLSPLLPFEDVRLRDWPEIIPTLSSAGEVTRMAALAQAAGRCMAVHLKVDTGMGRVGVWHEEAPALLQKILGEESLRLSGVFTHFASADSDAAFTAEQRARLLKVLEGVPTEVAAGLLVHADNSAGLDTFAPDLPFNAVRVGRLQFGVQPYPSSLFGELQPEPVLRLRARIGLVKTLPAGTTVGYGRTRTLEKPTRVAVLTAGYGDGIPTHLSNKGEVLVHGHRCPILGRVTMDQTIVDLDAVHGAQVGDAVTLIGREGTEAIDVSTFSRWAGSIPWEVFCSITKRVQRIYTRSLGV